MSIDIHILIHPPEVQRRRKIPALVIRKSPSQRRQERTGARAQISSRHYPRLRFETPTNTYSKTSKEVWCSEGGCFGGYKQF
jgi:hypothetical protein